MSTLFDARRLGSGKAKKDTKLSRTHKPEDMPLEAWQVELRKQFGREQRFLLKNVGDHPVFSDFEVTNPESENTYRVLIRGARLGDNACSCLDFTTNTLGTCKHIEFTLARLQRMRGGFAALAKGHQPRFSEIYLQYGARREPRFRPGKDCPAGLARLAAGYFGSDGALLPDAFGRFETFLSEAAKFQHDLRCHADALDFIAQVRDAEQRQERLRQAFPHGVDSPAFQKLLRVPLYDYQKQGALFAAGAGRCLIGDDMGLGKTVQAIAAAEIMARLFGVERVLVVCPTSLKHQWAREIAKFTARDALIVSGHQPRRREQFTADSFYKLTNYDTIHRDLDAIRGWSPDLVILDEAQRIKNWKTLAARSVKKIVSPYAIVLTGTPLENRLEELLSIVQFVDQHRLGPTFRFLHDHQIHDADGRVVGYHNLDKINKTLKPILLRRHKNHVLDQLPERIDKTFFLPMTPAQRALHEENRETVARIVHKWRRYHYLAEADQRRLMIALQNMRMACDSSYLLDSKADHGIKAEEVVTLLEEIYERADAKVVIFSQWLKMHELLERRFKKRGWDYVLFHGGIPGGKRAEAIDRFRRDKACRAFLSTDAGGVGLNLQFASVVLNVDLPWNPAVLEQRVGRVHRLGQKAPVQVFNFVSQGTIEEGMLSVLKFKKSLFSGILDGGETEVFLGGSRLARFMDTVEKTAKAIPEPAEQESEETRRSAAETVEDTAAAAADERRADSPAPTSLDAWSGLLQSGVALLQQLAAAQKPETAQGPGLSFITRDAKTGEAYLRLPLPSPEALQQAVQALGGLLENLRK